MIHGEKENFKTLPYRLAFDNVNIRHRIHLNVAVNPNHSTLYSNASRYTDISQSKPFNFMFKYKKVHYISDYMTYKSFGFCRDSFRVGWLDVGGLRQSVHYSPKCLIVILHKCVTPAHNRDNDIVH